MPVLPIGFREIAALIDTGLREAAGGMLPVPTGDEQAGQSLVTIVMGSLDDAKAEDTTLIDLAGKTSIADAMIIASGRSSTHVSAIADRLMRDIKDSGRLPRIEGLSGGDWVLIDIGDVIVHVFRPEVRQFYNLEKMWGADRPGPA